MNDIYNKTGKGIKIVVVDSGIDQTRKEFKNASIVCLNDCKDYSGHGTAVASIIHNIVPDAELYIYNLFGSQKGVSPDKLIDSLNFINSIGYFDIVHISSGVIECKNISKLYSACSQLVENGQIVVAAYDNAGSISYPAAFDHVIGVDWSLYVQNGLNYIYLENKSINILGTGSLQRVPWLNGSYQYKAGSSFAAPYITAFIAKIIENGSKEYQNIKDELKENAYEVWEFPRPPQLSVHRTPHINKAIILPFNKEMHSLAAFHNLLSFQIEGIYEPVLFRHVGKNASEILQYSNCNLVIQNCQNINWSNDFDTVILGHTKLISVSLKSDFLLEILEKCIAYHKNIYCFDQLDKYSEQVMRLNEEGCWAYSPKIDIPDIDNSFMSKLYRISTPVIGIFGTSPKQGKFTLQLSLKDFMTEIGYRVGCLGTEPSASLFNMDFTYPMGYENSVHISGRDAIQTINRFMHEIDEKDYEFIIVGSQSQTVPHNKGNLNCYPVAQYEFLLGTDPDIVILCINPYDEVEYINRTISYIQSYINTKVVALSLYPKTRNFEWAVSSSLVHPVDTSVLIERRDYYSKELHLPCYILGDYDALDALVDHVTDFFAY